MGAILEDAARKFVDPIEHTGGMWKQILGVIGFVAGVVLVVALCATPVGWVAMAALASTALLVGSVGMFAGEMLSKLIDYEAGDILEGSPNVTVGDVTLPAARVNDKTKCHNQKIAEGCLTIGINQQPAARVKSRTECNGKVKTGCTTVKYGGPWIQVLAIKDPDDPAWYKIFKEVVDWAGMFLGVAGLLKGLGRLGLRGALQANIGQVWKDGNALRRLALAHEVADPFVFSGMKLAEYSGAAFTQSTLYQSGAFLWNAGGTARGLNDARNAFRAPGAAFGPPGGGPPAGGGGPPAGAPPAGGPPAGAPPAGGPPVGGPPAGAPPAGAPPAGAPPAGGPPAGAPPAGGTPAGGPPAGAPPAGAPPAGAPPAGAPPAGGPPAGGPPAGAPPAGAPPAGAPPAGAPPAGGPPAGAPPAGAPSAGGPPAGAPPAGAPPAGGPPAGGPPAGAPPAGGPPAGGPPAGAPPAGAPPAGAPPAGAPPAGGPPAGGDAPPAGATPPAGGDAPPAGGTPPAGGDAPPAGGTPAAGGTPPAGGTPAGGPDGAPPAGGPDGAPPAGDPPAGETPLTPEQQAGAERNARIDGAGKVAKGGTDTYDKGSKVYDAANPAPPQPLQTPDPFKPPPTQ